MKDRQKVRDFLIRDLPQEVADKLKIAAALHHVPMKTYILSLLEGHIRDLEKKGITLSLPKSK